MSSYKIEKLTIGVEPEDDKGDIIHKMMEAALEHQCRVYANYKGKMYTISYITLKSQIVRED